jgi:hypothetical protein
MHDAPFLPGLTSAVARWSGHHDALAARLGRPGAVRLTEEQEALALGIARRLVHALGALLPLSTPIDGIWARWDSAGLPSAVQVAPAIFARVEEYRWRRMMTGPLHDPLPGLFADTAGKRRSTAVPAGIDPARAAAVDAALLALRIADGSRSDAFALPLLLPAELPSAALRALLFDIGAQDLAMAGDMNSRAQAIASAVEVALSGHCAAAIDAAARDYVAALDATELLATATADAMQRHDWLAVIAVVAGKARLRFTEAAAALIAADEPSVRGLFAALGVDAGRVTPLLDSLAEIPGRPTLGEAPQEVVNSEAMVQAVAARAESLRAQQRDDRH